MKAYLTYFGYFGWLVLLAYVQNRAYRQVTKQESINDKTVTRYTWLFALLAAAPLAYLAARRDWIGDTGMYRKSFESAATSFSQIPNYLNKINKDKAFYFFTAVFRTILGYRPVMYFGIVATFQTLSITKTLRKYTSYLLTGLFIFVASTDYISFMQNGIRQFVAVCIIFACSKWIFEKKYIPSIIAILVASQFHLSALLMVPVVFIVQGKPWNKSTVMTLMVTIIILLFVDRFTNVLDTLLSETQYGNVVDDWTSWNDNGTNPLRVLVYCVPMILSLIGIQYIRDADDPVINVCTNMSIISASLYLVSMVTSGLFIGRLPIYVCLYSNCILLPWEIDNIFSRETSRLMRMVMIVLFLGFYFYQVHIVWKLV